ncbi:MAG: RNA polymerase sigma factor [Angelakisella sp.]
MKLSVEEIKLARTGDRAAFGRLYESVALDLYRVALYTLGNKEDAEDAVSETFVEAYKGIGNLREVERFQPWIFKILSIRCKRRIGGYVRDKGNIDIDDYIETGEQGQDGGEGKRAEVTEALSRLHPEERELVVLSVLHGYTMREIAEIKDMPQGTVSSKLHRALKKLKVMLD